jgi:hypothetical protein
MVREHLVTTLGKVLYTTKIIKAGALLDDTRAFLANWDELVPAHENLRKFRQENIFGKTSRSRVEDILAIFRQRFLMSEPVMKALVTLVKKSFSIQALTAVLYFHAAESDRLLHDIVVHILFPMHLKGRGEISVEEICKTVTLWADEGRATSRWSDATILRVTQGLLSTLRDFGILKGAVKKRLAPIVLPLEAFCYIAMCLWQDQRSGERLVVSDDWKLFFLLPEAVERLFMEAHQHNLLQYHAAGSTIRVQFPTDSLAEYANVIVERTY